MSICIEIGELYVVTIDRFQFILQEKKTAKTGKNAGKEWLDVIGYSSKLNQLVSGLIHHDIFSGSAISFEALSTQVEQLGQQCLKAFDTNPRKSASCCRSMRRGSPVCWLIAVARRMTY